ncbi:LacI family DNA-binding transcriptional regulator [Jonesia quinghaiensis]|uniref:LacI family DNA-binding transcriptional regulator n=1 Tax=Jonesia quinghaiensis TaxID=262806 RepID=UPI0004226575|nr:LacI family DNA-binding transcriptional regulator [Jonesia quinghaiensis]
MSRGKPTIIDVAQHAGVSKSLVSLALRGSSGVKPETRQHILNVAQELGYRSNTWARNLAQGRSGMIGILLNDLSSAYHTDIAQGIEAAATTVGLSAILTHGHRDEEALSARLGHMQDLGADGIIVVSAALNPQHLATAAARLPIVVVGRPAAVPDTVGSVWNNDELGARLAVEHLAGLGHTRIAHLSGSPRPASRARLASFHTTMTDLALPEPHQVFHGPHALVHAMGDPATARTAPTAVFASNDRRAAKLHAAALDAGLRIPEDLAIVGYDNTELATLLRPQLTSIDQPRHEMGQRALHMLVDMLGGQPPRRDVVEPRLIARGSTIPNSA